MFFLLKATGFIEVELFSELMLELDQPMGWDSSYVFDLEKQDFFMSGL